MRMRINRYWVQCFENNKEPPPVQPPFTVKNSWISDGNWAMRVAKQIIIGACATSIGRIALKQIVFTDSSAIENIWSSIDIEKCKKEFYLWIRPVSSYLRFYTPSFGYLNDHLFLFYKPTFSFLQLRTVHVCFLFLNA